MWVCVMVVLMLMLCVLFCMRRARRRERKVGVALWVGGRLEFVDEAVEWWNLSRETLALPDALDCLEDLLT